jgi:hypothetical protein
MLNYKMYMSDEFRPWFTSLIISISENVVDGGHHISKTVKTCSIQQ